LKEKPTIPLFVPSFLVPPDVSAEYPDLSPDFIEYFKPSPVCVGTNAFTNLIFFNITRVAICSACVIQVLFNIQGRSGIIQSICNGDADKVCAEVCVSPVCTPLNQHASLVFTGQPSTGGQDTGKGEAGTVSGCITRNVFDPVLNDFVPPYTCPS
jgi:hypothetical protein